MSNCAIITDYPSYTDTTSTVTLTDHTKFQVNSKHRIHSRPDNTIAIDPIRWSITSHTPSHEWIDSFLDDINRAHHYDGYFDILQTSIEHDLSAAGIKPEKVLDRMLKLANLFSILQQLESSCPQYYVDEDAMTATIIWHKREHKRYLSITVSSSKYLEILLDSHSAMPQYVENDRDSIYRFLSHTKIAQILNT
jgi:hypothetical protein